MSTIIEQADAGQQIEFRLRDAILLAANSALYSMAIDLTHVAEKVKKENDNLILLASSHPVMIERWLGDGI